MFRIWFHRFLCALYWMFLFFLLVCLPATAQKKQITIIRNAAWNDMQRRFLSAHNNLQIVQKFMLQHEHEVKVNDYDIPTLRALDQAQAELKAAELDLAKVKSELVYEEVARKESP
jgi:hypothetical protein